MAFLHVATRNLDILKDLLQFGKERERFLGAADIWLGNDFDERSSAAVQIDIGIFVRVLEPVVNALAGVIFHVYTRDADALAGAVDLDFDKPMFSERLIILRNLVTLGKVGIKIILPRENRFGIHGTVQSER